MLVRLFYAIALIATLIGFSSETFGQTYSQSVYSQTVEMKIGTDKAGNPVYITAYKDGAVTEAPCFPGGDKLFLEFINDNRQYPPEAYEQGVQGNVTCQFLIDIDGSVKYVSLFKNANYLLAREAIRLLNMMPCWQPGKIDGEPVRVRVIKTIPFRR